MDELEQIIDDHFTKGIPNKRNKSLAQKIRDAGYKKGICGQCGGTEFKHASGIGDYCIKCGFDGQLPYKPIHPKPKKIELFPIEDVEKIYPISIKGFADMFVDVVDKLNEIINHINGEV